MGIKVPKQQSIEMKAADVPLRTNSLDAPTIYAEDIRGLLVVNGVVKLNLVENRVDAITEEIVAIHVATLVVPANLAANWGKFLTENLAGWQTAVSAAADDAEQA